MRQLGESPVRLRGHVGRIEEHPEDAAANGKWCFEIEMWNREGTERVGEPLFFYKDKAGKMFDTEEIAHQEMLVAIQLASEEISRLLGGTSTGKYYDMLKGGALRDWNQKEQ